MRCRRQSKLTREAVLEIRRRAKAGEPLAPLAAEFGISESYASAIGTGKSDPGHPRRLTNEVQFSRRSVPMPAPRNRGYGQ